jgi:uncharacterized protein YjiS (DUF1127 family)
MLTIQTTFSRPEVSPWSWLSTASRRLAHRWAGARLCRRMLVHLASLSDHELRDLGLEESPCRESALRDARDLKARLADRWVPHFLPDARAQRWL